ncbi:hypothetical protein ACFQ67_21670 [Streptomyces sp. NPDC056488]|uniref:hypothetical protein n=1 Tax=Streptomyces sp. NPDC056488 TaxID=3345836 RepID=UPI0036A087FF
MPRLLKRAIGLTPGPLKDLKDLLYRTYLAADAPTLDDIAADIADADGDDRAIAGAPSRDTVHRCISSAELPAKQADAVAVAVVLARRAAWDEADITRRIRKLWMQAEAALPLGLPVREVVDPFALEVHRAIEVSPEGHAALPLLPAYVERAHDVRLRELVSEALLGHSQLAVLVGESSSGKTRACWEAVQQLPDEWRLWHPIDPTRPEALLSTLAMVGPKTVVWLNEAQHYLLTPSGDIGERAAAGLRTLLRDSARAPIIILATIWPEHWNTLVSEPRQSDTGDPYAQARALLTGSDLHVASSFTEDDGAALTSAAAADVRVAKAVQNAEQGQITQYLAGAPALLERFRNSPPAPKAVISAAIDIRRMGHSIAIPHSLIEAVAENYLTDQQWDQLADNWLESALSYSTQPLRGARGPLTRIRPRRGGIRPAEPCYRLADYLEQHGGEVRTHGDIPSGVWSVLLDYADEANCVRLAESAIERNLLRIGIRLFEKAAIGGFHEALPAAAGYLWEFGHYGEALNWYRVAIAVGVEHSVNEAANRLWVSGSKKESLAWLEEASAHGSPAPLAYAGDLLWRDGRTDDAIAWYRKAADAGDEFSRLYLEHIELEKRRVDESLIILDRRAEEGDTHAYYLAAKILEEEGRLPEAVAYYKKVDDFEDIRRVAYAWSDYPLHDASRFIRGAFERKRDDPDYGKEPDGNIALAWDAAPPVLQIRGGRPVVC